MNVRKTAESDVSITLAWDPVPDAKGFIYLIDGDEHLADGKRHFTFDGSKTSVTIAKPQDDAAHTFEVVALGTLASGQVTAGGTQPAPTPTPTPTPAPTPAPTPGVGPSGIPVPGSSPSGWTRVFADGFDVDCPLGAFPIYGVANANTPKAVADRWTSYPTNYPVTRMKSDPNVGGYYRSDKTLSIAGSMLKIAMHHDSSLGQYCCAAPIPKLYPDKTAKWQMAQSLYGRYEICARLAKPGSTYKVAWLLWRAGTETNSEIDYPEFNLDGTSRPHAFLHYANATGQASFDTGVDPSGWHRYAIEWSPGKCVFLVDGKVIGTVTQKVPAQPMYWVIQSELVLGGLPLDPAAAVEIDIDWVTFDAYGGGAPAPAPAPTATAWKWDAATAKVDPNSASLMQTWRSYAIVNPNLASVEWGVATAEAKTGDPSYSIPLLKAKSSITVRCPNGTKPAKPYYVAPNGSGDSHLTIRDIDAGTETDLWQAEVDSSTGRIKQASAGITFPLGSVTEVSPGWGGNAASFPLRRGLVTPEDLAAGVIDHPLVFGCRQIGSGTPRWPAIHNAATTTAAGHLVEGSWLRLPPGYDTSRLTGIVKLLADAAKKYGMFLRDNSGSLAVYAEDPVNRGKSWPWTANPSLASFPWASLELLSPPAKA